MPPKKSASPKKKKKEVVEAAPKPPPPVIKENMVRIHFRLLNWEFTEFSKELREDTHIFSLHKLLRAKHGTMDDLRLCLHAFKEENEIRDEMSTLLELGLRGIPCGGCTTPEDIAAEKASIPEYSIYYDFKPAEQLSDPILLYLR